MESREAGAAEARKPRRPSTAQRSRAGTPAAAAAVALPRPATAGGKAAQKAKKVLHAGVRHSSDGGGVALPWRSSVVTDADLARWDGIEFRDVPYSQDDDAVGVERHGFEAIAMDGGGGGGGGGGAVAALRISTPVPIFNSPHDPLYGMLVTGQYGTHWPVAAAAPSSYGRGGRQVGRVWRGGSGGGGSRSNVNAEVPFKDSPARLRKAL